MIFAIDKDGKRVHIDRTHVNYDYFCPECGEKLVLRKGDIRIHHFAHFPSTECTDSWHYDMSEWHQEWQARFPEECQEVVMTKDGQKHRADVCVGKTVIEFQHSPLSAEEFDDRNNFYTSLGYKVVWVFDLQDEYDNEKIIENDNKADVYRWKRPKATFKHFNLKDKKISLFFQFGMGENDDGSLSPWLVKAVWATPDGFEYFATDAYSYDENDLVEKPKDAPKTYYREDVYNDMYNEHNCGNYDHGHLFVGCPLSNSGFATSDFDCRNDEYGSCCNCPHNFDYWKCKYPLDYLKIPDDAEIIEVKKDSMGLIWCVIYELDGKRIEGKLPKRTYGAKTIVELWDEKKPSIAVFYNIRTQFYVRINRNPKEQVQRYGKLYGKFSRDQYSFPTSMESSKEVFNYYKKEWICVWHKHKED